MLDPAALRAWSIPPVEQTYAERDTILYALGVGLGADPVDRGQLRFVYERGLVALPTMAGILGYPGFWLSDPRFGIDASRTVHGAQSMVLHRPVPASGSIVGRNRLAAVMDKGRGRGALVVTERVVEDARSGEPLATLLHTAFCRADGGFSETGAFADASPAPSAPMPAGPPDRIVDLPTRPESALLYRLSGDRTDLHVDPDAAAAAGFARPILHGMATFGVCGHAILRAACDYEPERLRSIAGRFSSPVFPGEVIRVAIWTTPPTRGERTLRFRATVKDRDATVLDHGIARVLS